MHVGERIKSQLFQSGHSAKWLSEQLQCERTNVYNIFKRETVDIALLREICLILKHDFFKELSEDTFGRK